MSKHLTIVDTQAEVKEAQKNLEEPFVILVKDGNELVYQDDSHCDAVLLIDDWNNYHAEIPVLQKDISWVKGRRCLVKKTAKGVAICYLDENNSELFHDGTTQAKLDGSMGQWMTDLPEFSYSCTEGESDWVKLHISKEPNLENKSRRVLVGVTEATYRYNGSSYKLWSCKHSFGETDSLRPAKNLSSETFHTYAINLGKGFDIVDYETHCKVAYMFMAKYKSKDPQSMEQFGTVRYNGIIGSTSTLGNNDGHTSNQTAIFGIEDWYGGNGEFMGGIHSYRDGDDLFSYYIYDGFETNEVPTVPYRTITYRNFGSKNGYISRMEWGSHADLIPIETSGSSHYFYPDYCDVGCYGLNIARRAGNGSDSYSGLFYFQCGYDTSYHSDWIGSRMQYRGEIEVIEDPQEFINLPVGF